ncbi:hypothetical protein [Streptomyces sp. NPDC052496]|uniref:hypothetical protein n=1 Tax=Streptomyces sp. NPDC052496 TaxID=3154951 RepID=UPI003439E543
MSEQIKKREQVPPRRPEDGPEPREWCRLPGDQSARYVYDDGSRAYAPVMAHPDHADGQAEYQVAVQTGRGPGPVHRGHWSYRWPRPGLHVVKACRQTKAMQDLLGTTETAR